MSNRCDSCLIDRAKCKALVSAGKGKITKQEIERREWVCAEERKKYDSNNSN